jgi:hypothetical protein
VEIAGEIVMAFWKKVRWKYGLYILATGDGKESFEVVSVGHKGITQTKKLISKFFWLPR